MELPEITKRLLAAKKEKSLSFADLETVVGRDEVWIAAVFYRQASASQEEAEKIVSALGLGPDVAEALMQKIPQIRFGLVAGGEIGMSTFGSHRPIAAPGINQQSLAQPGARCNQTDVLASANPWAI